MPFHAVRLIHGHPDDQNAEASAVAALRADEPPYTEQWPRETALRYLNAVSSGDDARVRVATPPTEKDLSAFLRPPLSPRTATALSLFEAVLGADRVASEIVSYFERGQEDRDDVLARALAHFREHMTSSDRARLDARIRVFTRTSATGGLTEVLRAPEKRASRRPPGASEPPAKPAKKKAASKGKKK